MTVTIEDLQPYVDKEAVLHLIQEDESLKEVTGTIKLATAAGIGFKQKGKSGVDLLTVDQIEEIDYAPVKEKSVVQKKLDIIEFGKARQHLVDRHGVELQWAKDNDEKTAFDWHAGLDHSNLGHVHEAKKEKDESSDAS